MLKTATQIRFDDLVTKVMWPEFKVRGYRKVGNNFRYYDSSAWGKIVNIQKSMFGSKDDISFTVNTGLYLPEADIIFEVSRGERFLEPDCLVRKRIGRLNGGNKDSWYDLNENTPADQLENTVNKDFVNYVLPYLDNIQTKDDILKQMLRERSPIEAINTLSICGYREEARKWLEEEISSTIYRAQRERLIKMRDELF